MRKPVIPILLWGLLHVCSNVKGQHLVDLSHSVDPITLDAKELANQLDTTNQFRNCVALSAIKSDFPAVEVVSVETYYQKSEDHLLLEMSKGRVPVSNTFLVSDGLGTTWWKISDGHCWVVLEQFTLPDKKQLTRVDRGCLE